MSVIYQFMDKLMPFSWVQYDFMKNAFLGILLMTPLLALLGAVVVQKKMTFFSDALGHSAITGIGIGVVLGISRINMVMVIFAVIFGILLNKIKSRQTENADTIISVFSSGSIAAGLLLLSGNGEFSRYSGILAGDVLSITGGEILSLAIAAVAAVLFWLFCFNKMLAASIHEGLGSSRGIPVKLLDYLFVVLTAVIVTLSIKCIGVLLINALLVIPAAAARNLSENMREYHFFSVIFALYSGMAGLILSYYIDAAAGPLIVIFAAVIYFASYFYRRLVKN